ncbi:coiled-coil domain containing 63 [Columba livia]|uniref:Coiled-coil domain containing 63 n=1 Tax=Columba livia TaxID=8932 RepID=A0A2I0M8A6_COLLI|nr:coiled-coil domain-containing protein 63 [Columba livia]PKK25911.1 coiled-coil domain containing 63 [Columba livia]
MTCSKRGRAALRRTLSDSPEREKEKVTEAEVRRLQKQYWIATEKRISYGAHMRQQMQTQQKEIESLNQERKEVLLVLSQITSMRKAMLRGRDCMELQCLLQTKNQYDSMIRDRKVLLVDVDNQTLVLEKKSVRQHQTEVKVKQANCSKWLQKQIEKLKLPLYNVTVQFGTILTRDKEFREKIQSLLIQKDIWENSHLKFRRKMGQQRRRMSTAIEQSTQAHKQQMETLARISAQNERKNRKTIEHKVEMQKRERVLSRDTKMKSFMLVKYVDRSKLEEEAKKRKDLKAAERAKRNQWEIIESREVAYRRLLELAEDGDVGHLVNGFIEKEQKKFALFSYDFELGTKIENMQQKVKDLQDEMTGLMLNQECAESRDLHALKEMEEKLTKDTEEVNEHEERCKGSSKVLGHLTTSMEALFKGVNCDTTKITKQLGENGQITYLNSMQFFDGLEEKTNSLLQMNSDLHYGMADESHLDQDIDNSLLGATSLLPVMDQAQLFPSPPTLDGTIHIIDAEEVPLDHGQLSQMVLQSHKKEEGNAANTGNKGRNDIDV